MHSILKEHEYASKEPDITMVNDLTQGEQQILAALKELHQLFQSNINVSNPNKKDDMLSVAQASEYSGFSKSFIYKITSSNEAPFYKPNGKTIFFKRSDIDEFLCRKKVPSNQELRMDANNSLSNTFQKKHLNNLL